MSVVATLPRSDRAKAVGALSVVAAGAALLSGGLVPALVIGGTGAFAQHLAGPPRRRRRRAAPLNSDPALKPLGLPLSRTMAKTITFRLLATTLDFSLNYAVIGEFGVAAGLSAITLVAGPTLYLLHETAWNRYGDRFDPLISRPVAKTITFRTLATVVDFALNYVFVADLSTTLVLTSSVIVLGSVAYLGHELAWERWAPVATER